MNKTIRIVGIVAVVVVIFAAIIASITAKPNNAEIVWDTATTTGSPEGRNYFIVYSDIVCPYCVAFDNAIIENEEEFDNPETAAIKIVKSLSTANKLLL